MQIIHEWHEYRTDSCNSWCIREISAEKGRRFGMRAPTPHTTHGEKAVKPVSQKQKQRQNRLETQVSFSEPIRWHGASKGCARYSGKTFFLTRQNQNAPLRNGVPQPQPFQTQLQFFWFFPEKHKENPRSFLNGFHKEAL